MIAGHTTGVGRRVIAATASAALAMSALLVGGQWLAGGGATAATAEPAVARSAPAAADVVGSWNLRDAEAFSPNARQYGVYLSFDADGDVEAVDGCLEYEARWKALPSGRIRINRWHVEDRDCLGRGKHKKQPLVKAFRGVMKARVVDGEVPSLTFTDAKGTKRSFTRAGEPGAMILLPGLFWVTSAKAGSPLLSLGNDGSFSADTGCGLTFAGTYTLDGTSGALHVTEADGTCPAWDAEALAEVLPVAVPDLVGADMRAAFLPRGGRVILSAS